jgi:hypothetical protein
VQVKQHKYNFRRAVETKHEITVVPPKGIRILRKYHRLNRLGAAVLQLTLW